MDFILSLAMQFWPMTIFIILVIIGLIINLFDKIQDHYSADDALELERRFINSIKSGDPRKFKRGITKMKENKNDDS